MHKPRTTFNSLTLSLTHLHTLLVFFIADYALAQPDTYLVSIRQLLAWMQVRIVLLACTGGLGCAAVAAMQLRGLRLMSKQLKATLCCPAVCAAPATVA